MDPDQATLLAPDNEANAKAIMHLSDQCVILFEEISKHHQRNFEAQLARFKIWIADLGVFANGHASVSYRLRDHPDVLSLVLQQLEVLKINLEELKSSNDGPSKSDVRRINTTKSESFEIEGEIYFYESPTEDSEPELDEDDLAVIKLKDGLKVVQDTITHLNALSTADRKSGMRLRTSKAELHEIIEYVDGVRINWTENFQRFASDIVNRETPDAPAHIKKRIALSISRRRNRLLYWRRYDKKSGLYAKKIVSADHQIGTTERHDTANFESQNLQRPANSRYEGIAMTSFTATTFDADNFRQPTESMIGSVTPTASGRWKNRAEFPKPPKVGQNESQFLCPICFILSPVRESKGELWIQHVTRDLKPYVCLLEGCKNESLVFDNFQDWIGHMKEEKMSVEWHCSLSGHHKPLIFNDQLTYETHMRAQHAQFFNENQLPILANRSKRLAGNIFSSCPFCANQVDSDVTAARPTVANQIDLQYHVASHLQSLSFISLPPIESGDDEFGSETDYSSQAAIDSRADSNTSKEAILFADIDTTFDDYMPSWIKELVVQHHVPELDQVSWEYVKKPRPDQDESDTVLERLRKSQHEKAEKGLVTKVSGASSSEKWRAVDESTQAHHSLLAPLTNTLVTSTPEYDTVDYAKREEAQRKTFQERKQLLGSDHPETLASLNNLAQTLFLNGKYQEAEKTYRISLAGREKILGEDHLDTIRSKNDLAQALVYVGNFKLGENFYREALVAGQKTLGPEHPYVLQITHNLGGALRNQGKHRDAEKLCRQALQGRQTVLGTEHPETLQSISNLGGVLEKMGYYEESLKLYQQALEGRTQQLGPKHPDTLQSLHSLGGALRQLNKLEAAEDAYRKSLALREEVLGPEHPNTMKSLNNLALVFEQQEKLAEAEHFFHKALETRRRLLGTNHPDTLQSFHNIASILQRQGKLEEAEKILLKVLHGRAKVFGSRHPDTLQSSNCLAMIYDQEGHLRRAEILHRRLLMCRQKILGTIHPHTLQSVRNLEAILMKQGKFEELYQFRNFKRETEEGRETWWAP